MCECEYKMSTNREGEKMRDKDKNWSDKMCMNPGSLDSRVVEVVDYPTLQWRYDWLDNKDLLLF